MARNTGDGHRIGEVRGRSQFQNPQNGHWTKRDTETGRIVDVKTTSGPFKGVRDENKSTDNR
jgi:hypothetical protein